MGWGKEQEKQQQQNQQKKPLLFLTFFFFFCSMTVKVSITKNKQEMACPPYRSTPPTLAQPRGTLFLSIWVERKKEHQ